MANPEFRKSYLQIVRQCGANAAVIYGEVELRLQRPEFGVERDGTRWYWTNYADLATWMNISYEEARGAVRALKSRGYVQTGQAYINGTRRLLIALDGITNCAENIVTFPTNCGQDTVAHATNCAEDIVTPPTNCATDTVASPDIQEVIIQEILNPQEVPAGAGDDDGLTVSEVSEDYFCREREMWTAARSQLELQLDRATFEVWLRDVEFYGFYESPHPLTPSPKGRGGIYVLAVRSDQQQEFLRYRLYRNVRRVLSDAYGQQIEIEFVVVERLPEVREEEPVPEWKRLAEETETSPPAPLQTWRGETEQTVVELAREVYGRTFNGLESREFDGLLTRYGGARVREALERMQQRGDKPRYIAYLERTLRNQEGVVAG